MINMTQGFDKGQFGKSMHRFEAITTQDLAPTAKLELLWILAEQEMVMLSRHDNNLNVFITFLCLPVGKAAHMDLLSGRESGRIVLMQGGRMLCAAVSCVFAPRSCTPCCQVLRGRLRT